MTEAARSVRDWNFIIHRSSEHFILPLVFRSLSQLPPGTIPESILKDLKQRAKSFIMHSLQIASEQAKFSDSILRKYEIPHAFMKGQALAGCYYQNPGERYCRDIDLLVDQENVVKVAELAQTLGYRVYPYQHDLSRRDLIAAANFNPVLCLVRPTRVLIEVHSKLDKTDLIFDTRTLLASTQERNVHRMPLAVLPMTAHFVFVCLHSVRHLWSHLNWLVDLDAMIRHPEFDEDRVLDTSREAGVESTVRACLELYWECVRPNFRRSRLSEHARDLYDVLFIHIEKGPDAEFTLRKGRSFPDFSFEWQASNDYKRRVRRKGKLSFLTPTFRDYQALPLPRSLHWLYYLTRPFSAVFRRGASGGSSDRD
ncbi:MAG: hypothetical protein GVY36_02605 [Verrucomicrobia bacterium]|nr:hypothetical protein [Verrucomicrobiota bacterium]